MTRNRSELLAFWLALVVLPLACRTAESGSASAGDEPRAVASSNRATRRPGSGEEGPPRIIAARADGDVATYVRESVAASRAARRKAIVYVGASWCEPCQTFHKALTAGELDRRVPGVDFIEFDLDRDRDRLVAAGYQSRYIPLFVRPGPDGRASTRFIEGSIKGNGAAEDILPRLAPLLL